jgi:hypothetical protein
MGRNNTSIELPIEKLARILIVLDYLSKFGRNNTSIELPMEKLIGTLLLLNHHRKDGRNIIRVELPIENLAGILLILNYRTKAIMIQLIVEIEYAYSDWCHKDECSTTLLL